MDIYIKWINSKSFMIKIKCTLKIIYWIEQKSISLKHKHLSWHVTVAKMPKTFPQFERTTGPNTAVPTLTFRTAPSPSLTTGKLLSSALSLANAV